MTHVIVYLCPLVSRLAVAVALSSSLVLNFFELKKLISEVISVNWTSLLVSLFLEMSGTARPPPPSSCQCQPSKPGPTPVPVLDMSELTKYLDKRFKRIDAQFQELRNEVKTMIKEQRKCGCKCECGVSILGEVMTRKSASTHATGKTGVEDGYRAETIEGVKPSEVDLDLRRLRARGIGMAGQAVQEKDEVNLQELLARLTASLEACLQISKEKYPVVVEDGDARETRGTPKGRSSQTVDLKSGAVSLKAPSGSIPSTSKTFKPGKVETHDKKQNEAEVNSIAEITDRFIGCKYCGSSLGRPSVGVNTFMCVDCGGKTTLTDAEAAELEAGRFLTPFDIKFELSLDGSLDE